MPDYWLENAARGAGGEPLHVLVDCGYGRHKRARDNADKLLRLVGRRNAMLAPQYRILIHIPPTKVPLLKKFKKITPGPGYCWTTHVFDKDGPQFAGTGE